jgi:hypothetical protein
MCTSKPMAASAILSSTCWGCCSRWSCIVQVFPMVQAANWSCTDSLRSSNATSIIGGVASSSSGPMGPMRTSRHMFANSLGGVWRWYAEPQTSRGLSYCPGVGWWSAPLAGWGAIVGCVATLNILRTPVKQWSTLPVFAAPSDWSRRKNRIKKHFLRLSVLQKLIIAGQNDAPCSLSPRLLFMEGRARSLGGSLPSPSQPESAALTGKSTTKNT